MNRQPSLKGLRLFLNIYGVISIVLFGGLFVLTFMDAPILQKGGALRFMRWAPLAKYVELMLEGVYFVWAIYFFVAARDPLRNLSFIDFTVWANAVHGIIMFVQSFMMPEFHYKIFTEFASTGVRGNGQLPSGWATTRPRHCSWLKSSRSCADIEVFHFLDFAQIFESRETLCLRAFR